MNESRENYLKTLFILTREKYPKPVRAVDIANRLGISRASVSRAMSVLREEGYVCCDHGRALILSDIGRQIAQTICERQDVLHRFLRECIQIEGETARMDACKVEHAISEETYEGIKRFLQTYLEKG